MELASSGSALRHSFLGGSSRYEKSVYPEKWLTEQETLPFEDMCCPVPAAYDAVLRQLYGDYMCLPPPEERVCKQHAVLVDPDRSYEAYRHYLDDMQFDVYTRSIR